MAKLSSVAPEVPAANLGEAIEYYVHKLGFRVISELPGGDYVIVKRDDVAIHLFYDTAGDPRPTSMHIFTLQLDELCAELQGRGARLSQPIIRKPWGNRDFRAKDPSGNEIKFTEPLPEDD